MKKILYITPHIPGRTSTGGEVRSEVFRRLLLSFGEVSVATWVDEMSAEEEKKYPWERFNVVARLRNASPLSKGAWSLIGALNPSFALRLYYFVTPVSQYYKPTPHITKTLLSLREKSNFDLIFVRYLRPAAQAGVLGARESVVVDIDDVDIDVYRRALSAPNTGILKKLANFYKYISAKSVFEKLLASASSAVFSNKKDADRFKDTCRSVYIPNVPIALFDAGDQPGVQSSPDSQIILILSSWSYPPNSHGLDWFLEHVWPQIHARVPSAVLRIAGSKMSEEQRRKWSGVPGTDVVGFVDSVADAYRECAFTISPVHMGGGTHVKVIESILNARICVLTPESVRGFENFIPSGGVVVSPSPAKMADDCVRLLKNPGVRMESEKTALELARRSYSRNVLLDNLSKTFESR